MSDPIDSARRHARTRKQHAQELAQDYVEAIADIIDRGEEAKVMALATVFGVSHVTVIRTVQRLQEQGLVETMPRRAIELTDAGREMAETSRHRHQIVRDFLLKLGVSRDRAEADSEGMEHHVSQETLQAMQRFVDGT